MKHIIVLFVMILLFSPRAFSSTPSDCTRYREDILDKAIVENSPSKFVRDEKKALELISQFNVEKLFLRERKQERLTFLSSCPDSKQLAEHSLSCEYGLSVLSYFKGLIFGMKNYGWKQETKALSEKKIWDYVNEIQSTQSSLLDFLIAIELVNDLAQAKTINNVDTKAVALLYKEASTDDEVQKKLKKTPPEQLCAEAKKKILPEDVAIEKYSKKFAIILSARKTTK